MNPFPFWRSIAYVDHAVKQRWHSQAQAKLRVLAKELGLERGQFDICSNYGGIAVSGEATLHGDHVYVQASQPFLSGKGVLYRRCAGRKDYTGDRNHFATLDLLNSPQKLAGMIERDIGPCYKLNANEVENV
jgi:hypothetical protein